MLKTGLSRPKLSHLMDAETWMDANKAVELGFADEIMTLARFSRSSRIVIMESSFSSL